MKQIAMIGLAGLVGAALTFAACRVTQLSPRTENVVTATDIVDTTANTTTIWDTTASDTTWLGSEIAAGMMYYGMVRSYHPRGTAAIVSLLESHYYNGKERWREWGMIYVSPQGNVVAARENYGTLSAKWRCIRPKPGDSISQGGRSLPNSAVLTKDPTTCEDMFK